MGSISASRFTEKMVFVLSCMLLASRFVELSASQAAIFGAQGRILAFRITKKMSLRNLWVCLFPVGFLSVSFGCLVNREGVRITGVGKQVPRANGLLRVPVVFKGKNRFFSPV